jgi:hypothetical protein
MNRRQIFLTVILFTALYIGADSQKVLLQKANELALAAKKVAKTKINKSSTINFADKFLAQINILRKNPKIVGALIKKSYVDKPTKGQATALTSQAKARVAELSSMKSLPKFRPSAKLFAIAKKLVASVKKSKNLNIKAAFTKLSTDNKLAEEQSDCFYFYPEHTKTPANLVLRGLISNTNGKIVHPNAVTSSYGFMTAIMLNEPTKGTPKKPAKKGAKKALAAPKKSAKRPTKNPNKMGPAKESTKVYKTEMFGAAFEKDTDPKRFIGCMIISTNKGAEFKKSPYEDNKQLIAMIEKYYNTQKNILTSKTDKKKVLPPSKSVGKVAGKITRYEPSKIKPVTPKKSKTKKAKPSKKKASKAMSKADAKAKAAKKKAE